VVARVVSVFARVRSGEELETELGDGDGLSGEGAPGRENERGLEERLVVPGVLESWDCERWVMGTMRFWVTGVEERAGSFGAGGSSSGMASAAGMGSPRAAAMS
jgi:hypothetical protein